MTENIKQGQGKINNVLPEVTVTAAGNYKPARKRDCSNNSQPGNRRKRNSKRATR